MKLSSEATEQIRRFASEQAPAHLDKAELSYLDQLRKKSRQAKKDLEIKLAKLKITSDKAREAEEDMIIFMGDYMADLMDSGMAEPQALEQAKQAFRAESGSDISSKLENKYLGYYEEHQQFEETIGLYYGAFTVFGMVLGAVTGIVLGYTVFQHSLLASILVSSFAGLMLGAAGGMLKHAALTKDKFLK